jgi:hypothetical protein
MKEGDEWQLVIPSDLGYGVRGAGKDIPPNQTLVFDMKLIAVNAPEGWAGSRSRTCLSAGAFSPRR